MFGVAAPLAPGTSRLWRDGVAATLFSALVMRGLVFYSRGLGPSVALTAHAREEDRRLALEAGYQRHVAKPPDPSELVSVVADLLGWR